MYSPPVGFSFNPGMIKFWPILSRLLDKLLAFFKSLTEINALTADNQEFVSKVKEELFKAEEKFD